MSEKLWSVRRKTDGVEVYKYYHQTALDLGGYSFITHDHVDITPAVPATPTVTVYGGRREISRLEFMRLFTAAERIAMRDFSAGTTTPAKALRDFMHLMEIAGSVSLDDADTIAGVNFLEQRGLLGTGRAAEILNG